LKPGAFSFHLRRLIVSDTSDTGTRGEKYVLEKYIRPKYGAEWQYRRATREEQFRGIDYVLRHVSSGEILCIDVKTEKTYTGNFAIEHISNEYIDRAGWAVTSEAHLLIYYFEDRPDRVYVMDMPNVKEWTLLEAPFLNLKIKSPRLIQSNKTKFYQTPIDLLMKSTYGKEERI
jgi:hypothetical protein